MRQAHGGVGHFAEKKLQKVLEKFDAHCFPRKNVTLEWHVFNTRIQQPGETIDQYVTVTVTRNKAKTCEFGDLTESLIKGRVVCGVVSDKTRSRLLRHAPWIYVGQMKPLHHK